MSFFDTTPLGRIINRFSKDVDTMDNLLSDSYRMFLMTFFMILATFILIIAFFYWFALALGPLIVGFLIAAMFYRATGIASESLTDCSPRDKTTGFYSTISRLCPIRRDIIGSDNCSRLRKTSRIHTSQRRLPRRHESRLLYDHHRSTMAWNPTRFRR
jgi:ABC-type multidrug transport system fused ATPase/permease subunit